MSLFSSIVPRFNRVPVRRGSAADAQGNPLNTIKPAYEVRETDDVYGLTVRLPGVTKDGLEITVEAAEIRVLGQRGWTAPSEWTLLHRETDDAAYELRLEHDNSINVDKVHAELRDGILRVSLPKSEAVKPRKVAVA